MALELVNSSVVVLAQQHNPTILHPFFLSAQGIVEKEWKEAEPPICTPIISKVRYDNGVEFTAEPGKLQILMLEPSLAQAKEVLPRLARKYVQTLPHVRYTAVGVNFLGFFQCENSADYLTERFLKTGYWNSAERHPATLCFVLGYDLGDMMLNLRFEGGKRQSSPSMEPCKGVVVDTNFHVTFKADESNATDLALRTIDRYNELYEQFLEHVKRTFDLKEECDV